MRPVPTWKWIVVLLAILISAWYLYPTLVWYQYSPEIRNAAEPVTPRIAEIDAELAEIRAATGESVNADAIRQLESDRLDEVRRLKDLRRNALPLGLDLAGGMHVVLEIDQPTGAVAEAEAAQNQQVAGTSLLDQALTVYRSRIDRLGLTEPVVEKQGTSRILIQIPGVKNPDDVLGILRATAKLEFRLAAPFDRFAQALDALRRVNPALEERLEPAGQISMIPVAEADIDSVSRAVKAAALEVPPGFEFMWGPLERNRETQDQFRNLYLIDEKIEMGGDTLTKAFVTFQTTMVTEPVVSLEFNTEGTAQFARVTSDNVNKQLAIVLDGIVYSAPNINQPIRNGRAIIEGSFTVEDAASLSVVLEAGALKTSVRIIENRIIGPSLGADSIRAGVRAAGAGLIVTVVFMTIYYMLSGVFANIALVLNLFMLVASLAMLHASLTLPGIAGIILTIGMAVDANVLVYERLREEVRGKPGGNALTAIDRGYSRALSAILDGNITTILVAVILMQYGTGPIKGFAVTLIVGLLISMFTALFFTRLLQDWWNQGKKNESLSLGFLRFFDGANFDFLKYGPLFSSISVGLLVVGMFFTVKYWDDIRGLELTGGTMVRIELDKPIDSETLRSQVSENLMLEGAQIQAMGTEEREFIIRIKKGTVIPGEQTVVKVLSHDSTEPTGPGVIHTRPGEPEVDVGNYVVEGLDILNPEISVDDVGRESFSASFGSELAMQGIIVVILSWSAILLYVSIRFQFVYSLAAVVALIHDVLFALGMIGISHLWGSHREVNLSVIAAFLTVIGFSVNDTIVIFDRIRENRRGGSESLRDIINKSLNQTLSRTIITSLTVFMVVILLFLFGGDVINDFAFVLMVGILAGSYSTVFIASYIVYYMQGKRETVRAKA